MLSVLRFSSGALLLWGESDRGELRTGITDRYEFTGCYGMESSRACGKHLHEEAESCKQGIQSKPSATSLDSLLVHWSHVNFKLFLPVRVLPDSCLGKVMQVDPHDGHEHPY